MTYSRTHNVLDSLRQIVLFVPDTREALKRLTTSLGSLFNANVVRVFLKTPSELIFERWEGNGEAALGIANWTVAVSENSVAIAGCECELPLIVSDRDRARLQSQILKALRQAKVCSYAAVPIVDGAKIIGLIEIVHTAEFHRWRRDDIFILQEVASILAVRFQKNRPSLYATPQPVRNGEEQLKTKVQVGPFNVEKTIDNVQQNGTQGRLVRFSNLIFLRTDTKLKIIEVLGEIEELIGIKKEDLQKSTSAIWRTFIEKEDLKRLRRAVVSMRSSGNEFSLEISVIKPNTKEQRKFLVHGLPTFHGEELIGFEGFGIDVTEKIETESQLLNQKKRIEALYEVARSTQNYVDPALVMLKGLKAVISATNSDCGMGCLYDRDTDKIEVAAVDGLSENFAEKIEGRIAKSELIAKVLREKSSLLIDNVQEDPRALVDIVRSEGVKSTIIVPLLADNLVLGIIVVYCRSEKRYSKADLELVEAAASQIAAAARQAEYYLRERRQADSMTALYKISHELSKYVSIREVSEKALPLLQKEFPSKRIWLGVMNEHGTHIAGQAGFGPGIRQRLINIQIELYLRHDFLDQAVRTKQPVIVDAGQKMECSGLNLIIEKLKLESFVIVPLISLSQVVGVVVIEPPSGSMTLARRRINLLCSLVNEIAAVILARRFESKMADADKMRMAGMLASGVAHNFNNLLQAVMGQASLIELQLAKDSPLVKSARMIIEAAGKGASLISQLLSFSVQDSHKPSEFAVGRLLDSSFELYQTIIGKEIEISVNVPTDIANISVDYGQFQQVVSNLLVNAKEAIGKKEGGQVRISASEVNLKSGEIDPELAPGRYVRIDIEDNGVGMDIESQARCFEPFFSSKNTDGQTGVSFSGSGLGLSSAYSIMKQHDGLLGLSSKVGEGTIFRLYFPVVSKVLAQFVVESEGVGRRGENADVVLYDLEDVLESTVRPIFASQGLKCVSSRVREDADDLIKRNKTKISAVLIDVDKNGHEILDYARRLVKANESLYLILVTADSRRWVRLFEDYPRVHVAPKPLGVWGIHAMSKRVIDFRDSLNLNNKIERELIGHSEKPSAGESQKIESLKIVEALSEEL